MLICPNAEEIHVQRKVAKHWCRVPLLPIVVFIVRVFFCHRLNELDVSLHT